MSRDGDAGGGSSNSGGNRNSAGSGWRRQLLSTLFHVEDFKEYERVAVKVARMEREAQAKLKHHVNTLRQRPDGLFGIGAWVRYVERIGGTLRCKWQKCPGIVVRITFCRRTHTRAFGVSEVGNGWGFGQS